MSWKSEKIFDVWHFCTILKSPEYRLSFLQSSYPFMCIINSEMILWKIILNLILSIFLALLLSYFHNHTFHLVQLHISAGNKFHSQMKNIQCRCKIFWYLFGTHVSDDILKLCISTLYRTVVTVQFPRVCMLQCYMLHMQNGTLLC